MRSLFALALIVPLFAAASTTNAATLNVVGGKLVGASGVDVGGNLYDVEFLDGTCIALFDGCDSAADFTFTTAGEAVQASQALLDQVFIDGQLGNFDTSPALTNGCENPPLCFANTPYEIRPENDLGPRSVMVIAARNHSPGSGTDAAIGFFYPPGVDSSGFTADTFASWTPVPEPSTALLMGLGLAGLAGVKKRAAA